MTSAARADDDAQLPYAEPRETMIPGNPGMPGGFHVMLNAFAHLQSTGIGSGTTPLLTDDWLMIYARDKHKWIEGLLMLNFEPLTVGADGVPELGQSGEGLWDAQHSHQLVHQAMIACIRSQASGIRMTRSSIVALRGARQRDDRPADLHASRELARPHGAAQAS